MSQVVALRCRAGSVTEPCPELARVLILTETIRDHVHDGQDDPDDVIVEALPACDQHALDEANELGHTANANDYLIIQLPAFGVGGLT